MFVEIHVDRDAEEHADLWHLPIPSPGDRSTFQPPHDLNIRLHRHILRRALELGPGVILRPSHDVEAAGPRTCHISLSGLLVEGV